jgi:hypothetical protein
LDSHSRSIFSAAKASMTLYSSLLTPSSMFAPPGDRVNPGRYEPQDQPGLTLGLVARPPSC